MIKNKSIDGTHDRILYQSCRKEHCKCLSVKNGQTPGIKEHIADQSHCNMGRKHSPEI